MFEKYRYCTLFDSKYLSRGLALYESLVATGACFELIIFAFDNTAYLFLRKLNLPGAKVVSLEEFEDPDLLRIKPTRSKGEYCWTCTPSVIKFAIEKYSLDHCTYIDADLFFWEDPGVLIAEMGEGSILITEHRYTPEYNAESESGKYCVQFVTFRNDAEGMNALNWWRNACIEWCYARFEDGKFGDQKYLDDWTDRFRGVKVLQNLGGGIAPWNVQQYDFSLKNNRLIGREISSGIFFNPIFYHFHDFHIYADGGWGHQWDFRIRDDAYRFFYRPYLKKLHELHKADPANSGNTEYPKLPSQLSTADLEDKIIPNLESFDGKVQFREAYNRTPEQYVLASVGAGNLLVPALIDSGFNLNYLQGRLRVCMRERDAFYSSGKMTVAGLADANRLPKFIFFPAFAIVFMAKMVRRILRFFKKPYGKKI